MSQRRRRRDRVKARQSPATTPAPATGAASAESAPAGDSVAGTAPLAAGGTAASAGPVTDRSKRTPERIAAILGLLREGHTRASAAGGAGIGDRTLRDWLAASDELRADVEAAEAEGEKALAQLVLNGAKADPKWAAWLLARRHPERYGQRVLQAEVSAGASAGPDAKAALRLKLSMYLPEEGDDEAEKV